MPSFHKLKTKPTGPRINIQEDHIGTAQTEICYPRIQSCVSLTVLTPHGLVGTHITIATEASIINDILTNMAAANPSVAYVIGGIQTFKASTNVSGFKTRKKMRSTIKKALPGVTNVYFYDTWQNSQDVNLKAALNLNSVDFAWTQGTSVDWNTAPDMSGYTPISSDQLVQR